MADAFPADDAPPAPVVRFLRPPLAMAIALGSLFWAANLYRTAGILFLPEQFLAAMFGTGLALLFLHFPARRGTRRGPLPWYDALLAALGFITGWYVAYDFADISSRLFEAPLKGLITATIFFVLTAEGLRRTLGWPLVVILLFFIGYSLVGHLVPGDLQTREVQLGRMMVYLGIDTSGLFGLIMLVGVTVVIPFLFFGQLLSASGGAGFFNDFSLGLMGRRRGGAAKISVLASSLFGTVSGVVVSNILATGVITIPLMKRSGFSPRHAAAIEATASTGGQLMPPVMGAVAFLMADFLQRPYSEIVVAALVPAILYYIALFIQADLVAAKTAIRRLEASEIPALGPVLASGLVFALPFAVLIYLLFWANREPEFAALAAALVVAAIGLVLGYKGNRMRLRGLVDALVATGIASLEILMIAAAAGFIAGILQATGLGFALTLLLVKIGGGNILALLVIAAILCILLGMGMPTLGVYVLLAVLIAPSLVEVGIPPLAAHMFILYLGMMSMITPPVAIGAFFAASLAGAEPMRTGFTAMRFGWTAYIVPFLFIFSPSLLLQNESVIETAIALTTAVAGVWLVSAGIAGFMLRPLGPGARALWIAAGLCLLVPTEIGAWAQWTDGIGVALAVLVLGFELLSVRRGRGPASREAPRPQ